MYTEELNTTGNALFRHRSYVPVLFLALLLLGMREFSYFGDDHTLDLVWEVVCFSVSMFGLAIRAHVVGHAPSRTSGRNTKHQVAHTINTTGLYSLVRHPLYVGNFFMWLGVAMFLHDWRLAFITVTLYWLYYERIMIAEENFLARTFGDAYREYASRTPAFVPTPASIRTYAKPELPFSVRNVLKREYSGFFAVVLIMFCLEIIGDYVVLNELTVDPVWLVAFGIAAAIYLTLRTLKRRTRVLRVAGR
ncbi:mam4 [Symbiodinium necroappetens]|uniref:Mam4 protein n=1 Tax=Symbiodinium necroappetens TaxID=1628268 RepID=A0A812K4T2_9DINO|nr:mam4 [Symbiodinium necroappetens]